MNASFNFSRLMQLVRKQWVENAQLYLFATLALIGILGLVIILWLKTSGSNFSEENLYIIFTFGIYIAGGVFASMSFKMLGEKEKGSYWLSLPATHLEKLLCIIFYNLIVFTLVYCSCFFLLKTLAVSYIQNLAAIHPLEYHFVPINWTVKSNGFKDAFPFLMYAFFAVQAFYLLGSVYFTRFSFLLTTVIGVALFGAFIWSTISLSKNMLPENCSWNGIYISISSYRNGYITHVRYQLPGTLIAVLSFLAKFSWAPVFWIATWYRLKEKEI